MKNITQKNHLFVISGLPGCGKSTLMVSKESRSRILKEKKLVKIKREFNLGGENEYTEILKDNEIKNLFYHYGIFLENSLFFRPKFEKIEKLIRQFNSTSIVICVCKSKDLFERFNQREISRNRKLSLKTINPKFIYAIKKMYSDYQDRKKIYEHYEKWLSYTSKFNVNYIIANTSNNEIYSVNFNEIKKVLLNII